MIAASTAFIGLQCDTFDHFLRQAPYFMAFIAFMAGAGAAAFLAFFIAFIAFMAFGMVKNGKGKGRTKRVILQALRTKNTLVVHHQKCKTLKVDNIDSN